MGRWRSGLVRPPPTASWCCPVSIPGSDSTPQGDPSAARAKAPEGEDEKAARGQLWIKNGDQLTERKIEAQGIQCTTCPAHVPPFSQSPWEPCLPFFKECPEPWPWGFSPTPGPLTEAGATFPWVFIAWQALSPLVSQHATYLGVE